MNKLKNSSMLAVSVAINLSIKVDFVSVNDPRETYFEDMLHIIPVHHLERGAWVKSV